MSSIDLVSFKEWHLLTKELNPSILVMSATPIPRTLSLAAYGDMEWNAELLEKPIRKKRNITTSVLTFSKEKKLIERLKDKLKIMKKFIGFVLLVEESEELDLKAATITLWKFE